MSAIFLSSSRVILTAVDDLPEPARSSSASSASTSSTMTGADAPELESGGKLMVEAYAAIWVIVLALVIVMWRRTRSLEDRVHAIDDALAKTPRPIVKGAHDQTPENARSVGTTSDKADETGA